MGSAHAIPSSRSPSPWLSSKSLLLLIRPILHSRCYLRRRSDTQSNLHHGRVRTLTLWRVHTLPVWEIQPRHPPCTFRSWIHPRCRQPHPHPLPSSKMDPFRKGASIIIVRAPNSTSATCAGSALRHLFTLYPQPSFSFTDSAGAPLFRDSFISTLETCPARLGLDCVLYAGHSFRCGAASSVAAAGYDIQLLGRWRSDAYKLYNNIASPSPFILPPFCPCPHSVL